MNQEMEEIHHPFAPVLTYNAAAVGTLIWDKNCIVVLAYDDASPILSELPTNLINYSCIHFDRTVFCLNSQSPVHELFADIIFVKQMVLATIVQCPDFVKMQTVEVELVIMHRFNEKKNTNNERQRTTAYKTFK